MTVALKDNELHVRFSQDALCRMTHFHYDRFDTPDDEDWTASGR
jgi:hypothetical protein